MGERVLGSDRDTVASDCQAKKKDVDKVETTINRSNSGAEPLKYVSFFLVGFLLRFVAGAGCRKFKFGALEPRGCECTE